MFWMLRAMFLNNTVWLVICELQCPYSRCRLGVPAGYVKRVLSARHLDATPHLWPWDPPHMVVEEMPWWVEFKHVEGAFPVLAVHPPREFVRDQVFAIPPLLLEWAERLGFKGFALDGQEVIPLWEPGTQRNIHALGIHVKEAKEP